MPVDITLVGMRGSSTLLRYIRHGCARILEEVAQTSTCEVVIERRLRNRTAVRIRIDSVAGSAHAHAEHERALPAVRSVLDELQAKVRARGERAA